MVRLKDIAKLIKGKNKFILAGHIRPDGDSLGSALALYHVLRTLGKKAVVYNRDRTPRNYVFLPGAEKIVHELPPLEEFEVGVVLDCGDIDRVGPEGRRLLALPFLINIDHHLANGGFTSWAVVDANASSTGELLFGLLKEMEVSLPKAAADSLYAAILTDTGGFRYGNTGKTALAAAAELVGAGADPQWLSENIYENYDETKIFLLKEALATLDLETVPQVGAMEVTREMMSRVGALYEHTEGLVDLPRTIRGVLVSALFTEMSEAQVKVSLRSKGKVNVEVPARLFGGGGHTNAASCVLEGEMKVVKDKVFTALRSCLAGDKEASEVREGGRDPASSPS